MFSSFKSNQLPTKESNTANNEMLKSSDSELDSDYMLSTSSESESESIGDRS